MRSLSKTLPTEKFVTLSLLVPPSACDLQTAKATHKSQRAFTNPRTVTNLVEHDIIAFILLMPYSKLGPERQRECERVRP